MAYQAKRHKRFEENIDLVDPEGNVVHSIKVSLDADDMVAKINRKYAALTRALADTSKIKRASQDQDKVQECVETLVGKPLFIRTIKQCRFTAIASPLVCPQADLTVVCIPVSDGVAVEARLTDGEKVYMDYRGKMAFDV